MKNMRSISDTKIYSMLLLYALSNLYWYESKLFVRNFQQISEKNRINNGGIMKGYILMHFLFLSSILHNKTVALRRSLLILLSSHMFFCTIISDMGI